MDGKNVLITGGLGLVGSALTRKLVELGNNVTIFTRSQKNLLNIEKIVDSVNIIVADIRDSDAISEAIKEKDFIFHLAGQGSHIDSMNDPYLDLDTNCKATLYILEACKKYNLNVKIVYAGTVREAGPIKGLSAREDQKESPTSIFDIHKLTSEKYMQIYYAAYGINTTTLRLTNVYGEGNHFTDPALCIVNYFVKKALTEGELEFYGDGGPLRDYIHVEDVVNAFISAAESPSTNGEYYIIGSGEGRNFMDFLETLKNKMKAENLSLKLNKITTPDIVEKIVQGNVIADYSKFKNATNWKSIISFEEGLQRTINFYLKNNEN